MKIIEQWSLVSANTHGYRDCFEAKIEPEGVVIIGLIFNHPLRGSGLHDFDDGRRWETSTLISMPDRKTVRCEDEMYWLGEPDPCYMRSYGESVWNNMYEQFREDGESDFDEQYDEPEALDEDKDDQANEDDVEEGEDKEIDFDESEDESS